jgi:excisionase family DNA binding protein
MDVTRIDPLPAVLTVDEARQRLRLGRNTIYRAIRRGELEHTNMGRRILIPVRGSSGCSIAPLTRRRLAPKPAQPHDRVES